MQIGSLGSILTTSYQPGTYGMGTYDVTAGVTDPTMTGAGDTDGVKPGYKSTPAECQTCKERKSISMGRMKMFPLRRRHTFTGGSRRCRAGARG